MTSIERDREVIWDELPSVLFVSLTKGKFAAIDIADAPRLSRLKWTFCGRYAYRFATKEEHDYASQGDRLRINMHHEVTRPRAGFVIDHKNGVGTDNRRSNLREASQSQNIMNQAARGKSGFKGVYKSSGNRPGHDVIMRIQGKLTYLGFRSEANAAAELYDLHCLKHRGEFAVLNFPERRPQYESQIARGQIIAA